MKWRTGKGFREEEEAKLEEEMKRDELDEDERMGNDNGVDEDNEEMVEEVPELADVNERKEIKIDVKDSKEEKGKEEEEFVDVGKDGKQKKACKRADWSGTTHYALRNCEEHKREAEEWKAANEEKRKELLRKNGTKWSILLEIPHFDPIDDVPIDIMHNLFQGELQISCY